MKIRTLPLVVLATFLFPFFKAGSQATNVRDSIALVCLYDSTDGAGWANHANWLTASPVGTWFGVTLHAGRVQFLQLDSNNLTGHLTDSLGNLLAINVLNLGGNKLTGNIPTSLGNLLNLRGLYLYGNQLSGNIPPSIGNLANLVNLSLAYNNLTGSIPSSLGSLSKLANVYLDQNQLSGSIPAALGSLQSLSLNNNKLTGSIPASFGSLAKLQNLYLQNNHLTGIMPASLASIASLDTTSVSHNYFSFAGMECSFVESKPVGYWAQDTILPVVKSNTKLYTKAGGTINDNTYRWYNGATLVKTLRGDSSFTPVATGLYSVTVTNAVTNKLILYSDTFALASVAVQTLDSLALVSLYDSTGGPGWTFNDGWLSPQPLSAWHGITVNTDGRVADIVLEKNHLTGHIPSSLGSLASLEYLNLYFNNLAGNIPASLGNLANLISLDISANRLTGSIPPYLGNLAKLGYLNLQDNHLSGPIPNSLANISKLVASYLNNNYFTFNAIEPFPLAHKKNSNFLYYPQDTILPVRLSLGKLYVAAGGTLGNNTYKWYKTGTLAATKTGDSTFTPTGGGLYSVTVTNATAPLLTLYSDTLYIQNPANRTDSLALVAFYDSTNGPDWANHARWLFGPVEGWYGITLDSTGRVDSINFAGRNNVTGHIPPSFGNLTKLQYLSITFSNLSGSLPSTFGNLAKLQYLNLDVNLLSGSIPYSIGNLAQLQYINLGHNNLSGAIPASIGKLAQLQYLDLNQNALTNAIPATLGNLTKLQQLILATNQLTGSIPSSLGSLDSLQHLGLSENKLTGSIPTTLGNLASLQTMELTMNQLSGNIPYTLGQLSNLTTLDLSVNRLSGSIPVALGNLRKLIGMYLTENQLSGNPPIVLANMPKLTFLTLDKNLFTFDGMETIRQSPHSIAFYYNPQDTILQIHVNGSKLSVTAGGTLSNNTYKWYKNGAFVASLRGDSTFTPTGAGNYTVIAYNSVLPLLALSGDTITVTSLAGGIGAGGYSSATAALTKPNTPLLVYPNPAQNSVSVVFAAPIQGRYAIEVTDLVGRVVMRTEGIATAGINNITTDVHAYAKGTYIITITGDNIVRQTVKVVKQ